MVALILQLHGYLEAHSIDILWMFVSSYCLEICIENLIIYRLLGAKFLGNSFPIPWKFQGNFIGNSVEIPRKFHRKSMGVLKKWYRSSIALILQLYGYLEAHSMDILWMFVSSYFLEISFENLIISYVTEGEIPRNFISNSMEIPRKFQWKFCRDSMEILYKFHGNYTESLWKLYRNGIEVLLH